jgi:hypothetical protein
MKKLLSFLFLGLLMVSCAEQPYVHTGRIHKIVSPTEAHVKYPTANLSKGDKVKLIRVYWTMGRRNESLVMPGVVAENLGNDLYEIKFDGSKEISETNIVRK